MPIRLSGLNSGLDTETIISALVSAKSMKVQSVKKQQTTLSWKQDAWKALNTKILNLYDNFVSKMRLSSNYAKKATTTSNDNAVKVITGANAVNGVQSLRIDQLAKTAYLTGGKVTSSTGVELTTASKISDLQGAESCNGTISLSIGDNRTDITINNETKISDVLSQLQSAGLNATFDAKNNRFFVSAKNSGEASDFSITASDAGGADILNAMGLSLSLDDDAAALKEYTTFANAFVNGDPDATAQNLRSLVDEEVGKRTASYAAKYTSANAAIDAANKTIDELEEKYAENGGASYLKTVEAYTTLIEDLTDEISEKTNQIEGLNRDIQATSSGAAKGELIAQRDALQAEVDAANEQLDTYNAEKADAQSLANAEKSLTDAQNTLDEVAANVDITVDDEGNVSATAKDSLNTKVSDEYYQKAAYASQVMEQYQNGTLKTGGATKIAGQDAVIYLNGAEFKNDTNTFEINGLTYTALAETNGAEVTITTQDDTDGIYDMIKDFFKEYNALINEMDKLYNAESASDYEPLTSEEKEAMSESEIEEWETKIKDALLRRDTTLNTVASAMKSVMSAGVEVNGKQMYLSSFGIATLGYFNAADNEKYAYHIDGDPDDNKTAGNSDVLKSMIANDPETVTSFFVGLSRNLYSTMTTLMKSTTYSSAYTVYDDKKMATEYSDYTTKIKELEEKLTDYEDKYYEKFAAMETALAKLSSKQNAIAGLFSS